jgi:hypothetical protein
VAWLLAAVALLLAVGSLAAAVPVAGQGSEPYTSASVDLFRSNMEWRTSFYGGGDSLDFNLRRRTLMRIYAQANETILVASSGIAVGGTPNLGDIRIFNRDEVALEPIGLEVIPDLVNPVGAAQPGVYANGFSCREQRAGLGGGRGRIANRAQEAAGPQPAPGGYVPCTYVAPEDGIYSIVFTGPSGANANAEPIIGGTPATEAADFGPNQRSSVTAWDAVVLGLDGELKPGRLFTYYYTGNTGGNGRPVSGNGFVITDAGFRYRVSFSGDPFGFVAYANQLGFRDADGNPLYRNLMADPSAPEQDQNQLRELQGSASLLPPNYPIFSSPPDELALTELGIPLTPIAPALTELNFTGALGGISTGVNQGGTFNFTSTQPGVYYVVVSRDGTNFDPTAPENRVLRGIARAPGAQIVAWDGLDNLGQPFPEGDYAASAAVQGGEIHFPFLDVENNISGGPTIELLNPPDITNDGVGDCPPWNGGCFGAFYDDRGYISGGVLVGTEVNGPLCPGNADNPRGFGEPPLILASDTQRGFDSRTNQRAFGFSSAGNPAQICLENGGFGDKKALDLWTFYPSNTLRTPLRVVDPTAVSLRGLTASRTAEGVVIRWETGIELNTAGFHVLRSSTGELANAVRVTTAVIPARGSASSGAIYSWTDSGAGDLDAGVAYWLEEVETDGGLNRYGPVRPGAAPAQGQYRVGLPVLRQ